MDGSRTTNSYNLKTNLKERQILTSPSFLVCLTTKYVKTIIVKKKCVRQNRNKPFLQITCNEFFFLSQNVPIYWVQLINFDITLQLF